MNLAENNNQLTGTGYLIVHVTTASGAIPLEGAQVGIREYSPENTLNGDFVAALISGPDGNTELISLPAQKSDHIHTRCGAWQLYQGSRGAGLFAIHGLISDQAAGG